MASPVKGSNSPDVVASIKLVQNVQKGLSAVVSSPAKTARDPQLVALEKAFEGLVAELHDLKSTSPADAEAIKSKEVNGSGGPQAPHIAMPYQLHAISQLPAWHTLMQHEHLYSSRACPGDGLPFACVIAYF